MTLTRRGRSGSDSFLENFASAEALAQASKASEAIYTYTYEDDSDVYWMPDAQRLKLAAKTNLKDRGVERNK